MYFYIDSKLYIHNIYINVYKHICVRLCVAPTEHTENFNIDFCAPTGMLDIYTFILYTLYIFLEYMMRDVVLI